MKKQYKIQLPKGKKVTMTNVDFEDGVMTVNVELESKIELSDNDREKIEDYLMSYTLDADKIKAYSDLIGMSYGVISRYNKQKYEPKDGDFISFDDYYGLNIAIYKVKYAIGHKLYCFYNEKKGLYDKGGNVTTFDFTCRPSTEEEKKLLIEKLAKKGKRWNEEKKCLEDVRWRAKVGETFYYIDTDCMINSLNRYDSHYLWKRYDSLAEQLEDERMDNIEYMLWKKGNYFKIREAAEKVAEQIREIFKNSKAE